MDKNTNIFYSSITENFDNIFPLGEIKKKFLKDELSLPLNKIGERDNNILTLGCSTGTTDFFLATELDNSFVTGIDIDEEMISFANKKSKLREDKVRERVNFQVNDITRIASFLKNRSYNSAICLGNTFVHILDQRKRDEFIKSVFDLFKTDGKFIMQIINYDNILEKEITNLPLIDNENVTFKRSYTYSEVKDIIEFSTELTVKNSSNDKVIRNSIDLYPIRFLETVEIFLKAGFKKENLRFYGDYKKEEFKLNSSYNLIIIAEK